MDFTANWITIFARSHCRIGGEQSGHIIFLNHTTTGDGILSSLQLIQAVLLSGKKPSELADEIEIFPQVLKNFIPLYSKGLCDADITTPASAS